MTASMVYEGAPLKTLTHEQLRGVIKEQGPYAVAQMDPAKATVGRIYPRGKIAFWWRVQRLHLWRLPHLHQPLWLGSDGVLYRAYDHYRDSNPETMGKPDHWKRAEIELRGKSGLRRIVRALTDHLNCGCNYRPRHF